MRQGEHSTLSTLQPTMDTFVAELRNSANVRLACQKANIDRKTAYNWRKKYRGFAAAWDDALEDAVDALEIAARKIALVALDRNMIQFLLRAHRREVYGDKIQQDVKTEMVLRVVYDDDGAEDTPAEGAPEAEGNSE